MVHCNGLENRDASRLVGSNPTPSARTDGMRVTQITTQRTQKQTTFSADFIFARPYGGKKQKLWFWAQWLWQASRTPGHSLTQGFAVRKRIWYTVPTAFALLDNAADAFFIAALPLAIAMGEDLTFENSVSTGVIKKTAAVQDYYQEIAKRKIAVRVKAANTSVAKIAHSVSLSNYTGQFFTLGVDSFFTLCCYTEKSDPTSHLLIYVDGYDVPFYQKKFLRTLHKNINHVATKTNNTPVYVETNIRQISDAILGWGRYHVSGLVAVATLLGLKKIYISGESFDSPDWGLRHGVDVLYSRKQHKVRLVGHAMVRIKKIKRILHSAQSSLFLQFVRVCWENVRLSPIPYNCSVCQKCLKTKLTLTSLGIKRTPTLHPATPDAIQKLQLVEHVFSEWQELYEDLQKSKRSTPALLTAIKNVLEKPLRM